jgi:TfoX/Sxy family transcriptional regulator of competence genes
MSRSKNNYRDRTFGEDEIFTKDPLIGKVIRAKHIGDDCTNGHRGMSRAVRGAKKFVNSRRRFHEKAALKHMEENPDV